jgi:hypothetical protein
MGDIEIDVNNNNRIIRNAVNNKLRNGLEKM